MTLTPAPLTHRAIAFAIDFLIYRTIVFLINKAFLPHTSNSAWIVDLMLVVVFIVSYFALLEGPLTRSTLGKRVMKLQVVDENGKSLSFSKAYQRSALKMLPILLFMSFGALVLFAVSWGDAAKSVGLIVFTLYSLLNYGSVFLNKNRQALYDKITKTMVVSAHSRA